MMDQLVPYIPAIVGLAIAAIGFLSVRHIASNRFVAHPRASEPDPEEASQERLPFDGLKTNEELRAELRKMREEREHT